MTLEGLTARFDELGVVLDRLAGTTVDLLQELGELAGNVCCVAVEHWCVTSTYLARVVKDNDLSIEGFSALWRVILGITSDVPSSNFFDGNVLYIEANIVTRNTLGELFMMHLHGLDFSGHTGGSKGHHH